MANKIAARLTAAAVAAAMGISAVPMIANAEDEIKYEYGVFLNSSNSKKDIEKMSQYRIIVLDAQGFEREDIMALKKTGHTVYSYINLGSVENWRDYYNDYADITFADYEDWDDERWVNSAETKWQTFQYDLAKDLIGKGIDGFFVDNIDVYYVAKEQPDRHDKEGIDPVEVFDGVTTILKSYKSLKTSTGDSAYVLINGGDTYVHDYIKGVSKKDKNDDDEPYGFELPAHGNVDGVLDGVNQEALFGEIDFDADPDDLRVFKPQSSGSSKDYQEYVELVDSVGKDVYLLEYTDDESIMKKVVDYCAKHDFNYFTTDRGDLTTDATTAGSMPVRKDKLNGNNNSTSESKSESKSDSKSESKSESKTESKSSSKTDSKSESKNESKSSSKADSKISSKPESKTESKADSKIGSKPESKTDSKADSKIGSKPESKTESKADSKIGSKPESKTESKADSKTGSKPDDTSSKADGKITVSVMKGDADLNGSINVSDIAVVASHIKGIKAMSEAQFAAADVNNDGQMTVSDIAIIAAHIKGIKAIV